jgi:excisionase family DNA binding protein
MSTCSPSVFACSCRRKHPADNDLAALGEDCTRSRAAICLDFNRPPVAASQRIHRAAQTTIQTRQNEIATGARPQPTTPSGSAKGGSSMISDNTHDKSSRPARRLIRSTELAEMLGVHPRTISRMLSSGRIIQPIRLGGSVRWRLDEVEQWIADGCPRPDAA